MAEIKMDIETINTLLEYKNGGLYWKVARGGMSKRGTRAGTKSTRGYRLVSIAGKRYKEHRVIFFMHHGYLPVEIDHIDGDTSNNSIENLRAASRSQNCTNRRVFKTSRSGTKGVTWNTKEHRWWVRVQIDGKRRFFGAFEDVELATLVAQEAQTKYCGVFVNHNGRN